jgi:DNA invertase Pin-like site-specific DNA recombinase
MPNKTAICYARVSDRKQADDDVSVPTQIELAGKRADDLGATMLRVFTDAGRSAFKESNRRVFEAAIEFAVAMEVTYFIVWSSSRFARNRFEAVFYKRELDRAGINLVYLSSSVDRKTDDGWLLDSMFEIVDEMQSRQIAKDTRRSMIRNAQHGFWVGGRTPYGYQSVPAPEDDKRRKVIPQPEEAFIVGQIFARRAMGIGAKSIAMELNDRGVLNRGRVWKKQTVLYLLKSQVYIGIMIFNRRTRAYVDKPREEWVCVQSHEPLIALELFDQVQTMIGDAADRCKGSPKSMHPFTGLLRCGACGEALQTETANGNGGHYAYYNCRSALQGVRCRGQRQRADEVDKALSSAIFDRVLSRKNLSEVAAEIAGERRNWSRDLNERRRSILANIQEHQRRNESLYQLLELHGKDAPNLGDLTKRLRINSAVIKDAENMLVGLDAERDAHVIEEPEIEALGDFLRSALSEASNAARAREFYRGFIESIVVTEGKAEIRYDPAKLLAQNSPVRSTVNWRPVFASLRTIRTLRVTLRSGRTRALRVASARSA